MKNSLLAPIISLNSLSLERNKLDRVVLVGGGFDIIHEGHVRHLQKAKSLGNNLIVHITSDERIKEKKGPGRPIFQDKKRALVISAIKFVDYVFIYNGKHYDQEVIDKLKPDVLFFNKEAFSKTVEESLKNLKGFEGEIVISDQQKLDSTSRAVKAL